MKIIIRLGLYEAKAHSISNRLKPNLRFTSHATLHTSLYFILFLINLNLKSKQHKYP